MSEHFLTDDSIMLQLLRHAAKTEGAAQVEGDWHGVPYLVTVVTGANVGLVKKYAVAGQLALVPDGTSTPIA